VTIKGTLETFNLRELLQMLAFNQKVGTLVLETERGPRTIYVDRGRVAFVSGDRGASRALLRVIRRRDLVPEDRLQRAMQLHETSGHFLGDILGEMGIFEGEMRHAACEEAFAELFLDLQLSSVAHFEFADGRAITPDGRDGDPIEPQLVVESLLLDLTRKMDQWHALLDVIPTPAEIFEGTGIQVDLAAALAEDEIELGLADLVVPCIDGYRTLDEVADASNVDRLTVLTVATALLRNGGIRPVATEDLLTRAEDLLSRGDAHRALPMLRRTIEREDAPPEARLRLADALEASGSRADAAAELDTYANTLLDAKPLDVFDALHRAMDLRDGDTATAARLCDFYVENRPWLADRHTEALGTLRLLIHGAVTERRPVEAAERLQQFIEVGEAPGEDLLVLADLYASGGRKVEAAEALFQRAEDLLAGGRVAPARDLLRRVLQLDPTRGDARTRLHVIEGEEGRRRRKRRLIVFLFLLGLMLVGAGAAWWMYNQEAGRAVRHVRESAEHAMEEAEAKANDLISTFEKRVEEAIQAKTPDEALGDAGTAMVQDVKAALSGTETTLYDYARELERFNATDLREANAVILRHLEARKDNAIARAEGALDRARSRGKRELRDGENATAAGNFSEAHGHLLIARNLAFDDPPVRERAELVLGHVNRYQEQFQRASTELDALRAAGDIPGTYQRAVRLLAELLDSDLTRKVRLPVSLASQPPHAAVWLGGKPTTLQTPCVLEYDPFGDTDLVLRLPGRVPYEERLPSFSKIKENARSVLEWTPSISVSLPAGPRWRVGADAGPFAAMWTTSTLAVLLTKDGSAVQAVDPETGTLGPRRTIDRPNPVRAGGALPGDIEWRILGLRTLLVRPGAGQPWEIQALGHLERRPVLSSDRIVLMDDLGTVYCLDARSGDEFWRRSLGRPPSQDPLRCAQGVVVTTSDGGAYFMDVGTGTPRSLGVSGHGQTLAVPLGDEFLVIGGGAEGLKLVDLNGDVKIVGAASPDTNVPPWVTADGVAWVEGGRVRWFAVGADAPVELTGLGEKVVGIAGIGGTAYGTTSDGLLRAVNLASPAQADWQAPLGGTPTGQPLVLGDSVYVLVDGGLTCLAR
jgi:tetratricopeptide (TPR) repeat protein